MSHAVSWFQIEGPDARVLQGFYKRVFGWKMSKSPGDGKSQMVAAEPGGIAGGVSPSHGHHPGVTVYVTVGDIDALVGAIQRAGGRMVRPKTLLPEDQGAIAEFADPAGNILGLWSHGEKRDVEPYPAPARKTRKVSRRAAARTGRAAPAKRARKNAPSRRTSSAPKPQRARSR
jgi:predicted enzyme related to lactoylglutathione lyase